ncbi:MAG: conjugal transfer protein TraX [Firmicutes bacterium]|nr:conjugal transfer protein TraX [Bacillota bacterium]
MIHTIAPDRIYLCIVELTIMENNLVKGINARQLKIIACISMLFSHSGVIFWPAQVWWQVPGRIAMPIFAFMIANGFRYSHNVYRYMARLFIFAALIQYPYSVFLANGYLNICFTLGLGLVAIIVWQSRLPLFLRLINVLFICFLSEFSNITLWLSARYGFTGFLPWLHTEYGWYGIMMILSAHIFFNERQKLALMWLFLNLPLLGEFISTLLASSPYPSVQGLCIMAIPFIFFYNGKRGGGNRYEFYIFYIGHLAILYALRRVLWGF